MKWWDEGMVGEHWGSAGSGLLLIDPQGRMLLAKRSDDVTEPGTWGVPGGALRVDETGRRMNATMGAMNEFEEEMGSLPPFEVVEEHVWSDPHSSFTYTTVVGEVSARTARDFVAELNWENDDWAWQSPASAARLELHPGLRWLLNRRGGSRVLQQVSPHVDLGAILRGLFS